MLTLEPRVVRLNPAGEDGGNLVAQEVRGELGECAELLATRPNEIWSSDMTKQKGPAKWTYYRLYAILDIFSRYMVGRMITVREDTALVKRLIASTCEKQNARWCYRESRREVSQYR